MKPLQFDPILESKDSKDLEQHLIDNGCLCPSNCNNDQDRKQALHVLETIVSDWTELKHSETIDNSVVLPTLITFGSYGLRVHRLDSDVDVLCLFGNNVTRGEFFSSFVEFLEKDERISKLLSIPDGFTPIVKFYLNGIHIDLLFGNVSNPTKLIEFHQKRKSSSLSTEDATGNEVDQQEYQIDDSDLIGKDEAGVRSLNGVRVTQFIEENISNMDNFRICLGTIKEWAVLNGIYSNKLGFLGGINFAILLAKVCIENPESETWPPSTLLKLFFRTYALWEWPKPVILTTRIQLDPPPQVSKMQVWDPIVNRRDAMPIITPVYPSMNSSYNVNLPQLRRIQEETIKGAIILEKEERGWRKLIQGRDFFQRHSNFIQVTISANDPEEYTSWLRFCQSKMRFLISCLETKQTSAWPFTKFFDHQMKTDERPNAEERLYKSFFFIALRFSPSTEKVNLKHFTSEFLHKVNYWDGRKAGMDLHIMHVLQADLPAFVINDTAEGQAAYLPSTIAVLDESNTNSTPPTKRLRVSSD